MAAREAVHHVRRRQHHEANILIRIDAGSRHPETQLVIVVGERECHAEGQRLGAAFLAFGNQPRQGARRDQRIGDIAIGGGGQIGIKLRRYRDGIAINARLKGVMIGTRTWPMPRLEATATGASKCAASNRPS